jgi:Flp pilus assembly protein TadD
MRALPIAALLLLAACANNGGPGQADGLPNAAATAFHRASPEAALQIDDAILVRDPRNVAALLSRGDAQTALQQPDQAEESYNDALRADPHSTLARIGLGRLRLADDPSTAEAWFLAASQSDPHNAVAWNDLGIARDMLGRHQDAQAAYRQAIGLDASMHGAQVNLALSLAMTGHADDTTPVVRTLAGTPAALPESLTSALPAQAVATLPAAPVAATAEAPPAPAPAAAAPSIVLTATADAWMQVRDKSGQVLLSRILHPGESWSVPARPQLVLTTGNAGGTDILLAGVAIPPLGPSGAVRRNIPLDAGFLMAGKLPSTARQVAAASVGSPIASPAAPISPAPSAGLASVASGPAPFAASDAATMPTRATDTAAPSKSVASASPAQAAAAAPPILAVTRPRTMASAVPDAAHQDDRGFLAAVLSPGMHALTIGVDGVTDTAAPIWPGDRVDLILTQEMPGDATPPGHHVAASMVLPRLRVIAIDQQIMQGVTPQNSQKPARRVTFEVNRDQAEQVSVATRLGHLWLAAHPADTAHQPADSHLPPPTVWASEAVAVPGRAATPDDNHVVRVFPGAADSKEFHF